MLLIHSSVKRAAHALAYFSLEGMFANDILNKRHTDDIARMAISVLPNISVLQLANDLLAMSVHFNQALTLRGRLVCVIKCHLDCLQHSHSPLKTWPLKTVITFRKCKMPVRDLG